MAVKMDYWDEAGQLLKTSTYTDIQLVDQKRGKWQAMRLEVSNVQTGHSTKLNSTTLRRTSGLRMSFSLHGTCQKNNSENASQYFMLCKTRLIIGNDLCVAQHTGRSCIDYR